MTRTAVRSSIAHLRSMALLLLLSAGACCSAAEAGAPYALTGFDQPFQFTYLSWQDKVPVVDGRAVLKGLTCNGGAGVNGAFDLSAHANRSPALTVRVHAANTAKSIRLSLTDRDGRIGRWIFDLPAGPADLPALLPRGSAALANPHVKEDKSSPDKPGAVNLAGISQYQVYGDWSKDLLDIEIDAVVLVEPDERMLAEREAYAQVEAEAAAKAAKLAAEEKERLAKAREHKLRTYTQGRETAPQIVHTGLVAPDIISIAIEAQRVVPATLTKYEAQPGDEKIAEKWPDGGANDGIRRAKLKRDGKTIGTLQGKDLDHLSTPERFEGDPFLDFIADDPDNFTISSADDPAYAAGVKPAAIYRKTVPTDAQLPGGGYSTRHRLYLKLPSAVLAGKTYRVQTAGINVKNPHPTLHADFTQLLSESIHVNQHGYRPDDPLKRATLSIWLGTGGAYRFAEGTAFSLIDDATRKPVYTGRIALALDVDGTERLWTKPARNYASTAVYRMDFGDFTTPGTYRVCVDGVGCSYPFAIQASTWESAFQIQMKGLYNNRSGIEIGPPYSDFRKPRDFHPDDGAVVTRTTHDAFLKGQYNIKEIPLGDTGERVVNAWGGYHDAGDWNPRRVSHMATTLVQLELAELHPAYFNRLSLNIPPTAGIPDIITEALFEIDCFRRLQLPDGGIPWGIESQTDPGSGEVSWLSTQHLYVLPPTMADSWFYAAVAARAAKVLRPIRPELAAVYEESAVRAFDWAEADHAKRVADGSIAQAKDLWRAVDWRNLAALVLYDLTGSKRYHDVFMIGTCLTNPDEDLCAWGVHIQTDAVFLYARLDDAKADPRIKRSALAAMVKLADFSLAYAAGNAFGVTCREKGRPMFAGFFSVSGGMEVARAHYLTGRKEYLAGAIQSCQFGLGCNPGNLVYTTGMGSNPVRHPLHVDSRSSGQPVPAGFTVFGNVDYWNFRDSFWDINLKYVNKPDTLWPNAYDWPLSEAYFDVYLLVSANEFVIETWQQNIFTWGYLAARP